MSLIAKAVTVMRPAPHDTHRILQGLDMRISPGEVVAVAGRPGTGKSTLVAVLSGASAPGRGEVFFDEPGLPGKEPPTTSALFERPEEMFLTDSVNSEVALALQLKGFAGETIRERVGEALLAVGLEPGLYGERRPDTLSTGEQRRLALAILLAARPAYICLDEPGAGLDAGGLDALERLLRDLKSAGMGIMVTGRDTGLLWSVSDRILVLENGRTDDGCPARHTAEVVDLLERHGIGLPDRLRLWASLRSHSLIDAQTPPTVEAMAAALAGRVISGGRG